METKETTIGVPQPFSLRAAALSHGWHECAPIMWCDAGRCLQLVTRDGVDVFRVSVLEGRRTRRRVSLRVIIDGPALNEARIERFTCQVRTMLKLDQDLDEFYTICRSHPTLYVLERIGAGRTIRSASMTENIIKMICGTNVNWNQAVKMINRIAQIGPIFPHYRNLNAWPAPREILAAGETYLIEVARVGYRAKSILKLCQDSCDGTFDPDALDKHAKTESSDRLLKRLLAIDGVGPASAHALLSMLGHYDHLSIDSSTVAHVSRVHTSGKKPTKHQIEAIYEPYGRWKNLVWWFELWLEWDTAKAMAAEAGL